MNRHLNSRRASSLTLLWSTLLVVSWLQECEKKYQQIKSVHFQEQNVPWLLSLLYISKNHLKLIIKNYLRFFWPSDAGIKIEESQPQANVNVYLSGWDSDELLVFSVFSMYSEFFRTSFYFIFLMLLRKCPAGPQREAPSGSPTGGPASNRSSVAFFFLGRE